MLLLLPIRKYHRTCHHVQPKVIKSYGRLRAFDVVWEAMLRRGGRIDLL